MRETDIHALATALEGITPRQLASQVVLIDGSHDLFQIEARSVIDAIPGRRAEFAAGRSAARRALGLLGIAPMPIPRAGDRRPVWPSGIVGSISHANGFAAAIVGFCTDVVGAGLDIEPAVPLKNDLRRHILTPAEIRAYDAEPMVGGVPRCKVGFVAKEALFKAVYPITRNFFGFQDALVDIQENGSWSATLYEPPPFPRPDLAILDGRWTIAGGMIAATVRVGLDTARAD